MINNFFSKNKAGKIGGPGRDGTKRSHCGNWFSTQVRDLNYIQPRHTHTHTYYNLFALLIVN